jgi:hypothetical protein
MSPEFRFTIPNSAVRERVDADLVGLHEAKVLLLDGQYIPPFSFPCWVGFTRDLSRWSLNADWGGMMKTPIPSVQSEDLAAGSADDRLILDPPSDEDRAD